MLITKLYKEFFESEKTGGLILVFATFISLMLANSAWQENYTAFWNYELTGISISEWINEGLMSVFFLLIGLELVREIKQGELSNLKNAALPVFGAFGGMIIPIVIYLFFNFGKDTQPGFGIPMATDIAFAVGILSLLGKKVPVSLKVFLTALAVIDDLGAIIVIAVFYCSSIVLFNLFMALLIFVALLILNRLKVSNLVPYLAGAFAMWYFMLNSGVHATITGVLVALTIPSRKTGSRSASDILQHFLNKPVAFFILPLFALANTCIPIKSGWFSGFGQDYTIGIMAGLILGKPIGIWLFSFVAASLGLCTLPSDLKWKNILGAGLLGGIGFTMSIFITLLSFDNSDIINTSKIAIILSSVMAGAAGYLWLKFTLDSPPDITC